jgi:hypothetical protein
MIEHAIPALLTLLVLQGDYGFWSPVIGALKAIGVAAAGVGLIVAILIKAAAAANGDRHALAARVAERAFAGLFLIMLGWFIYDRIVAWTPM